LRRQADHLTVLCQAGAIATPRNRTFLSFLEPIVHGVSAPGGGVFHPKVWLLRYLPQASSGPARYRLLVLSRNLTYDRSWDTILRLDADLSGRPLAANRPLSRFVFNLIERAAEAVVGITGARRSSLETIAEESSRLPFELPDGVEECVFWPLGIDPTSAADVFSRRRDRTLVASPFVSSTFVDELALGGDDILISSSEELGGLPDALRQRIGRLEVIEPAATEVDSGDDVETAPAATAEDGLSGLHAKLVVADAGWKARLWTGSANATAAAFGKNVEFVVEMVGSKKSIGVDAVLGTGKGGLADLLVPYVHDAGAAEDTERRRLEHLIDLVAREFGAATISLRAVGGDDWSLALEVEGVLPSVAAELEVLAWPATLREHRSLPVEGERPPQWDGLDILQLTGFLCLEIAARTAGIGRQVVISVPLLGAPEGREAEAMRSVLDDPERVLKYLLFLLGDPDREDVDAFEALVASDEEAGAGAWFGFGSESTLFEALVRTLHRDPDRIDRVESLISELGGDQAAHLLPAGFESLFAQVREARWRRR
jgi:hypothetical protein